MTIETLEQYRSLRSEIKSINASIEAAYDTRKSPNGRESGGYSSEPSAPTERAVRIIGDLEVKRDAMLEEWTKAAEEIEKWLDTVTDADIRSIVRWRYILGYGWKRTSREVYGVESYYRASKKFYRYIEKNSDCPKCPK